MKSWSYDTKLRRDIMRLVRDKRKLKREKVKEKREKRNSAKIEERDMEFQSTLKEEEEREELGFSGWG